MCEFHKSVASIGTQKGIRNLGKSGLEIRDSKGNQESWKIGTQKGTRNLGKSGLKSGLKNRDSKSHPDLGLEKRDSDVGLKGLSVVGFWRALVRLHV